MKTIEITRTCPMCSGRNTVFVPAKDYEKWKAGELIQNALSTLSVDDRELLMTGICPACWDETFPEEDEEDNE